LKHNVVRIIPSIDMKSKIPRAALILIKKYIRGIGILYRRPEINGWSQFFVAIEAKCKLPIIRDRFYRLNGIL
jgi:hypothetical protein